MQELLGEHFDRSHELVVSQQDRLVNMRIDGEVDATVFAKKQTDLRDRMASLKLQLDAVDRSHDETADLVSNVLELSQTLRDQWLFADHPSQRRIL